MEENLEFLNEEETAAISRYSNMVKNRNSCYFDVFEFEHIIDFYIEKFDLKSATDVIEYALKLHPNSSIILLKKAQVLINNGHPYKSLSLLKKLTKIESSNHTVFFLKGVVYSSLGELSKAISKFEQAINLAFEGKDELLLNIASTLQQIGQFEFAAKYYKQAFDLDGDNTVALYELAYCYEKINKDAESVELYKVYLSTDPFSKLAWYNLAGVYSKLDEYEYAIDALEYVIAIDPKYTHAYYQKGLNQIYNENFELSIETFKEYLQMEPVSPSALFHVGESYAKLANSKEALSYFEKSLKLDNLNAEAFYGQAYIYYTDKKYTDAYYSIKRALKIDSEDPDFWHLSALICQSLAFITEAEKAFKKAIEIDFDDPQIWIDYSKLEHANKDVYRSIGILSEAHEHFPDNAEINYRLAANLALIQNFEFAAMHLKIAINSEPENLDIFQSIFSFKNKLIDELIENLKINKSNFGNK